MPWSKLTEEQRIVIDNRILKYSYKPEDNECIIWTGACSTDGTPRLHYLNRQIYIPRYVLSRRLRRGLLKDRFACHTCDNINGPCINILHLYEGTRQDNVDDMMMRGRHISQTNPNWYSRGEQHAYALTEQQVLDIDQLLKERKLLQVEIAKRYNISSAYVCNIKKRKRWKHLFTSVSEGV